MSLGVLFKVEGDTRQHFRRNPGTIVNDVAQEIFDLINKVGTVVYHNAFDKTVEIEPGKDITEIIDLISNL